MNRARALVAMPKTRIDDERVEISRRVEMYRRQVEQTGHIERWIPKANKHKETNKQ